MQQGSVVACQRCGAIYAATAGACPQCGAKTEFAPGALGQMHEAGVAVMRPRPERRRQTPWATIVAVGGTALVGLIASLFWLRSDREEPQVPQVRPPEPVVSVPSAEGPRRFDADLALDRARAEALRWNADATLAGFECGPFVAGKLSPEGALRAEFGRPGGAHVGPGAGLHKEILLVTVSQSGVTSSTKNAPGRVGLAEPNCIVQDVWRTVLPDAVDGAARLTLRYEQSPRDGRAVYRILKEGSAAPLRILDGTSCAFLVR